MKRTAIWDIVAFGLGDKNHMPDAGVELTVVAASYGEAKSKGYILLRDMGHEAHDIDSCLRRPGGPIYV